MANARVLQLDTAFTDSTLPRYPLEVNSGTLLLVDPMRPGASWAAGVPATVPNAAWSNAATLIGSGTESSLALTVTSSFGGGTRGVLERTTKGGLHGYVSQTNDVANARASIANTAYDGYFAANPTHKFFFTWWGIYTRAHSFTGSNFLLSYFGGLISTSTVANSYVVRPALSDLGIYIQPTDKRNGTLTVGTPFRVNGVISVPSSPAIRLAAWGPQSDPLQLHHMPSHAFHYQRYEDITVSGNSYAECDTLDTALYQQAVLTSGGRYYGDTYTAPTSI